MSGLEIGLEALTTGITSYKQEKERLRVARPKEKAARIAHQRQIAEDTAAIEKAEAYSQSGVAEQEINLIKQQNEQLSNEMTKKDIHGALRGYDADSNVRHFNQLLENPKVKDLWGNPVAIDKIDLVADQAWMEQQGIDISKFTDPNTDKQAFLHKYLKMTRADGSRVLADVQDLMAISGYSQTLDDISIAQSLKRSQINKNEKGQVGTDPVIQRKARAIAEAGLDTYENALEKLYKAETAGVTPGKLEIATEAEVQLETVFKDKYFETDFSKLENRRKAAPYIRQIEQAGGEKVDPKEKAEIRDISMLIASGQTVAEELTPEATGMLDNLMGNVQKYVSDEKLESSASKSAFNAYRNALLRSFGGTAMSDSEVKNFNAAFGTLNQKYPAVVSQFKQAILQTKAKLETIARFNNPHLVQYYLGTSQDDVDIILSRLDQTLERLNTFKESKKIATPDWKADWAEAQ